MSVFVVVVVVYYPPGGGQEEEDGWKGGASSARLGELEPLGSTPLQPGRISIVSPFRR